MDRELLSSIIERYESASFIVYRRMNAAIREGLSDDLTLDQMSMIRYLRKHGQCTATELAEAFCVGKSSISAITSRLFDKQFIRRIPDETDRRVTYFALTEEGYRKSLETDEKIQEILMKYIGHFSEEEALRFIETFEKLAKVLKG
jgi:DNA-binding MarR family transcriptional regulator